MVRKAIYMDGDISIFETDEWDFHGDNTKEHLHALHSYPARFIPQIPYKAIREYTIPGDVVLDPFCGGGTALLESMLIGRPAIGVDNNPVAHLISRAKTAHYLQSDVLEIETFLNDIIKLIQQNDCLADFPTYSSINYWFDNKAIIELGKIRRCINALSGNPKLLALAVFSGIIVRISYQDSDTRYSRKLKEYKVGSSLTLFKSKLKAALLGVKSLIGKSNTTVEVYLKDGRDMSFMENKSVDFIITSPPYINAYDYHKYHRHRIHWINGDVEYARNHEIGKHDTFTRNGAKPDKYFEDMGLCFGEWVKVLKPNKNIMIIVGDGIVNKQPVPVADKFIEQLNKYGAELEKRWIRKLDINKKSFNQAGRMNKEHVLLFRLKQ